MEDIAKTYKDNLAKLKPLLPRDFAMKVAEKTMGVTYLEVKKAFGGKLKNADKLALILASATEIAEERKKLIESQTAGVDQIVKHLRKKIA